MRMIRPRSSIALPCLIMFVRTASAQCTDQVTHLQGSQVINGVDVTVTSSGIVDVLWTYCAETFPYLIGADDDAGCGLGNWGDGEFTFAFNPPIPSASINFSGVTQIGTHAEEVVLYVNGSHYAIPAPGQPQSCDTMAVLSPVGNVAACANCSVSGWGGTPIPGPISTLAVKDTVIAGEPGGAVFSLFICANGSVSVTDEDRSSARLPYPNPATDMLSVDLNGARLSDLRVLDASGRNMPLNAHIIGAKAVIDTRDWARGSYAVLVGPSSAPHRIVLQ